MKKTLSVFISIFLFVSLVAAFSAIQLNSHEKIPSPVIVQTVKAASPPTPEPTSISYSTPVQIVIPKISLSADIVPVGLDSQNRMDVPDNFIQVGWYDLGAKPGEQGSAVLDGHSDDFHGNPAVFFNLDQLQKGDQILVTDQTGKKLTFTVEDNVVYPTDQMPLQQIFAADDKARLNLITCHGEWDTNMQTYNQRTVIYAVSQYEFSQIPQ